MAAGLTIYLLGGRYLPTDPPRVARSEKVKGEGMERSSLLLFGGVILAVVVFRVAYEQVGNTLALWIGSDVDRSLGGWTIPMTWFQSLNPLLVFLLTPILVTAWDRSARNGRDGLLDGLLGRCGLGRGHGVPPSGFYLFERTVAAPCDDAKRKRAAAHVGTAARDHMIRRSGGDPDQNFSPTVAVTVRGAP